MNTEIRDRIIAGSVTLLFAAILLLVLFAVSVRYDRQLLARESTAEIQSDEPLFFEPELLDLGHEDTETNDQSAPSNLGEPEKSELQQNENSVKQDERPAGKAPQKTTTQNRESSVKEQEPVKRDEEDKRISDPAAGKFSPHSGKADGKAGSNAPEGEGSGVTGSAKGRKFLGCDMPKATLRFKTVITVRVTVSAEGRVTQATATSGGDASIRRECERAARTARWSAKKGASDTHGTITFTIIPK